MQPRAQKGSQVLKSKLLNIFLSEKKFKNLVIPGKLYVDYFQFNNNLLKCLFLYAFQHFVYLSKM